MKLCEAPCTPKCGRPVEKFRKYCHGHMGRYRRGTDLSTPIRTGAKPGAKYAWLLDQLKNADPSSCWVWHFKTDKDGYPGYIRFGGINYRPTQLALILSGVEKPYESSLALHSCDNPPCVNPSHLRWGSHVENAQDALKRKRIKTGDANYCSKLTNEQATYIRETYRSSGGISQQALADQFGISQYAVSLIVRGLRYKEEAAELI